MCLGVPGKVLEVRQVADGPGPIGTVDFQGNRIEVSLALVPEVAVGAWVLVHAGMAIEELDAEEARSTWEWLKEAELVDEIPGDLAKGS